MGEKLLTTVEAAERLGVTPIRVRQLIKAGRLPSQQFGRDHVINEANLTLVAERKPGRPKKDDGAKAIEATRTSAPVKTVIKKPAPPYPPIAAAAKKRTAKKAGRKS